jgi:poly-gamma-glutamate synthesis protein (capsule biosynthesis protein)
MADRDELTLAITGNSYIEHPISQYRDEGFVNYVELLRNADATVANLECAIVEGHEWPAYAGGMGWALSYLGAPPLMVDELKSLGITALAAANNHAADFGENGILSTITHLRAGGIPFAGVGASLTEAAEPCYVSTGHGRIALISAADWGPREGMDVQCPWPFGYMPSDDGPWYTSRPGVNLLRYDAVYQVDREAMDQLRRISKAMDWERSKISRRDGGGQNGLPLSGPTPRWEEDTDTQFHFMSRRFVEGDAFGFTTFPYPEDLERLVKSVRDARRAADVVMVALHDQIHGKQLPAYVRTAANACIDAGADVFLLNGGTARGIEIYKGKALIHGQQSFGFQNSQVRHVPPSVFRRKGMPADSLAVEFYEDRREAHARAERAGGLPGSYVEQAGGLVHTVVFDQQCEVKEIRGYPAANVGGTRHRLPVLLEPSSDLYTQVMQRAANQCKTFGTDFEVRDGYGVVAVK